MFTFFSGIRKIEKIKEKFGEQKKFSTFFPEMFFEKLKKKVCRAEIPHPARQCA